MTKKSSAAPARKHSRQGRAAISKAAKAKWTAYRLERIAQLEAEIQRLRALNARSRKGA